MQRFEEGLKLGRRIVTWGATGSGKTTFTHRVGGALGLRVVQLDAIRHETGWDSVDWPEFRERLTGLLYSAPDGWMTDGSYSPISDVYLSRRHPRLDPSAVARELLAIAQAHPRPCCVEGAAVRANGASRVVAPDVLQQGIDPLVVDKPPRRAGSVGPRANRQTARVGSGV